MLIGFNFGVSWPAFNALIAAVVEGDLRQQYFGINFALVNLGIGVGGIVGGVLADVDRPATFTFIFLGDAASGLIPLTLLLWPLRHVHGRAEAHVAGADPDRQGRGGSDIGGAGVGRERERLGRKRQHDESNRELDRTQRERPEAGPQDEDLLSHRPDACVVSCRARERRDGWRRLASPHRRDRYDRG